MDWLLGIEALSIYRNGECLNQNTRIDGNGFDPAMIATAQNEWTPKRMDCYRCCDWSWAIPSSLHLSMLRKPFRWGKNLETLCNSQSQFRSTGIFCVRSFRRAWGVRVPHWKNLLCGTWSRSPPTAAIHPVIQVVNTLWEVNSLL